MTKQLPITTLLLTLGCKTETASATDEAAETSSSTSPDGPGTSSDAGSTDADSTNSDTSESDSTDTGSATDPLPAQLLLHVTSTAGADVSKATITIDGQPRFTDSAGFLSIEDLALDATLFTARIDAAGYASASLSVDLSNNLVAYHEVQLFALSEPQPLDAELGGTVALEGVSVTIPPGSVVNQWGEFVGGEIEVTLTHLDPTDPAELAALPAPLEGVTSEDEDVALLSVAMAEVSLWQDGMPLQLAEGATATLTLALPDTLEAELMPGDPIPAWSLDLDLGVWVQEGMGTVELVEGELVWSVEVDHFTWWNIDSPSQWTNFECYYVVVEDSEGKLVNHGFSLTAPHQGGIFTDGGSSSQSTSNVVSNCGLAPIGAMPNFTLADAEKYSVTPSPIMGNEVHNLCRVNGQPNPNCTEIHVMLAPEEPPVICQLGTYMTCPYPPEYQAQLGMGACEAGKNRCVNGGQAWEGCKGEWTPQPESCATSYDDDCDGTVDDPDAINCGCTVGMIACYGGPAQTYGIGMCDAGWRYCDPQLHEYGECVGDIVPVDEDCNSPWDEDCDGLSSCDPPAAPQNVTLGFSQVKQFDFGWAPSVGAQWYQLLESVEGEPHAPVGGVVFGTATSLTVPLHFRMNSSYIVQACNSYGCTNSITIETADSMADAVGRLNASNADENDGFGSDLALSGDGNTLAVGTYREASSAMGVDGTQFDNSSYWAGAVYVFSRSGSSWPQQAYIKASNSSSEWQFGNSSALSFDGNLLAVGAPGEGSGATGINGKQFDMSASNSGAVYLFSRQADVWAQQTYIKASNTDAGDSFGWSVALSSDGNTLAVGAPSEGSNAVGNNGDQADDSAPGAGAVYVYIRQNNVWTQHSYVKASNTNAGDGFGQSVALSGDGNTLAVGAYEEQSGAVGINGDGLDNSMSDAGAVYVYRRNGMVWAQQAYVKASNTGHDNFGQSVALSNNGNTLAVGARCESSSSIGINGDQADDSLACSGAVYVIVWNGNSWMQQAYIKAPNPRWQGEFGYDVALSSNGNILAVAGWYEGMGDVFVRDGGVWQRKSYLRVSSDYTVALSSNGNTLAAGYEWDGIFLPDAGAAWIY